MTTTPDRAGRMGCPFKRAGRPVLARRSTAAAGCSGSGRRLSRTFWTVARCSPTAEPTFSALLFPSRPAASTARRISVGRVGKPVYSDRLPSTGLPAYAWFVSMEPRDEMPLIERCTQLQLGCFPDPGSRVNCTLGTLKSAYTRFPVSRRRAATADRIVWTIAGIPTSVPPCAIAGSTEARGSHRNIVGHLWQVVSKRRWSCQAAQHGQPSWPQFGLHPVSRGR